MKLIQHVDGVVVDIRNAVKDITIENIALADSIPSFEHKEGFNGVLMYNESGLYWDYKEVPAHNELTDEEFMDMLEEVL